jgi:replicative DNA helicase
MNRLNNEAAEMSLLGAVLRDNNKIEIILEHMFFPYFQNPAHQKIFEAAIELFEEAEACDVSSLSAHLQKKGELEEIGGEEYLTKVLSMAEPEKAVSNATKVAEAFSLRRLRDKVMSHINEIEEGDEDFSRIAEKILCATVNETEERIRPSFYPISSILKEVSFGNFSRDWQPSAGESSDLETTLRLVWYTAFNLDKPIPVAIFSQGIHKLAQEHSLWGFS